MSKKTLCIRNLEELTSLLQNEGSTIKTFMVPRSICETESESQPFKQIIPYVCFNAMNDDGTLMFLAYNRPVTGGESRLHGDTSIGFGGHMDDESDFVPSQVDGIENIEEAYVDAFYPCIEMDRKQFITSIYNAGRREVIEELGIDLFDKLGVTVENMNLMMMQEPEPDAVGRVHMCMTIMVDVSAAAMFEIKKTLDETASEREVENLRVFGINLDPLMKNGVEKQISVLQQELLEQHQFERWSAMIAMNRALSLMEFMFNYANAGDLFRLAVAKMRQSLVEKQKQETETTNPENMDQGSDEQAKTDTAE